MAKFQSSHAPGGFRFAGRRNFSNFCIFLAFKLFFVVLKRFFSIFSLIGTEIKWNWRRIPSRRSRSLWRARKITRNRKYFDFFAVFDVIFRFFFLILPIFSPKKGLCEKFELPTTNRDADGWKKRPLRRERWNVWLKHQFYGFKL